METTYTQTFPRVVILAHAVRRQEVHSLTASPKPHCLPGLFQWIPWWPFFLSFVSVLIAVSVVCLKPKSYLPLFKKILFIYLFLERGEGKEKDREGNINVWLLLTHPHARDFVCNLGFCPDWESNQRPFGSQAGTQSTDAHQPGVICHFFIQNPSVTPTSSESISIP